MRDAILSEHSAATKARQHAILRDIALSAGHPLPPMSRAKADAPVVAAKATLRRRSSATPSLLRLRPCQLPWKSRLSNRRMTSLLPLRLVPLATRYCDARGNSLVSPALSKLGKRSL
jgi:hypothetical protein